MHSQNNRRTREFYVNWELASFNSICPTLLRKELFACMVPLTLNAIRDLTSKERIAEPDKHCKALQNWIRHQKDLRAKENKRGTTTQSTEFYLVCRLPKLICNRCMYWTIPSVIWWFRQERTTPQSQLVILSTNRQLFRRSWMKSLKEIVHRLTFLQKINLSAEAYKHFESRECRAVN